MTAGAVVMRCGTCGRFRAYREGDGFCIACGAGTLDPCCACGRPFDYALDEPPEGGLHCPRCGRDFRGPEADGAFR